MTQAYYNQMFLDPLEKEFLDETRQIQITNLLSEISKKENIEPGKLYSIDMKECQKTEEITGIIERKMGILFSEIVLCKDCKHSMKTGTFRTADGFDRLCVWYKYGVSDGHFCSHGERR